MYEVYLDGDNLLYSSRNFDIDDTFKIFAPKLSQELGKSGSFTFQVPEGNACYKMFKLLKTGVDIYKDEELFWRGRVLDVGKEFFKTKAVTCEGIMGYLNDTLQDSKQVKTRLSSFFISIIEKHNSMVEPAKRFTVGEFTITDVDIDYNGGYVKTMDLLMDLVETYGGFIVVTYGETANLINWYSEVPTTANQVIRIGENLTDLVQQVTSDGIVTCLVATGKEDAKLEDQFIRNDFACEMFGDIWDTVAFTEIEDMQELKDTATKHLDDLVWATMEISIGAVDLRNSGYDVDSLMVGKNYKLISEEHSVIHTFPCTGMDIDLQNPDNDRFTLGAQTIWSQLDDDKDYDEMIKGNAKIKTLRSKQISSRAAKTEKQVETTKPPYSGRVVFSDNTNLVFESGLLVSGTTLEGEF